MGKTWNMYWIKSETIFPIWNWIDWNVWFAYNSGRSRYDSPSACMCERECVHFPTVNLTAFWYCCLFHPNINPDPLSCLFLILILFLLSFLTISWIDPLSWTSPSCHIQYPSAQLPLGNYAMLLEVHCWQLYNAMVFSLPPTSSVIPSTRTATRIPLHSYVVSMSNPNTNINNPNTIRRSLYRCDCRW